MPHSPVSEEAEYDPWMLRPPTPAYVEDPSKDEDSFKDEEPFKDEELDGVGEQHDAETGGDPTDSSPYPDSSSHDDSDDILRLKRRTLLSQSLWWRF